ncbi:MAG TPA: sigma-54-dependent Fis family transcriptional regulator [Zoogloea sp.]|uniref:sigma-54 interaction domain-containing protein n=1 Tax=Zoogloea sp. TaxID=49181 RepID=UPI002B71FE0D|nr:sigma-54-dependent Fis family transcriptional regulator [Zoogloea sp.]HMV62199.1 sigma-54-dependent Fis family transcriptional regulator [Rhodocyclaceae bacterium]HMW51831.1 sigma-54-dependent Fis family transcriptional regulator [Rhodocyclaceae bacterium]HMY49964.1 sigma-54-dependent Fis family transcriptional regulator [Rhodocyclaceae bacterium]HMZ76149.1 sigma-54-dependent Fis family transcriptional regulator [Rhodocyclaceae bacterium]HNA67176.1 sigma-54-dependent Fis family transcriptio
MSHPAHPLPELVSFLESLPEPHILCDRSYRILAANAAYRAKCARPEDLVGRTCYEVSHRYPVPCDRAGESCPLALSLQSGQRERVVHLHHTSSGERYEKIELSPVRDARGEIAYFIEKLEPLPVARGVAGGEGLIGRAATFRGMLELVARVAPSEATVLLQGESGTGKELVARAIHDASRRADRPFVAVDCSGLTETLFESELFGHERGAFTGATVRKVGLVEAASGGTLFLDEMGDIPLSMQVKLLRLLETGTYRRVGSTELVRADIRLISATHRPLKSLVGDGRFRQDLFYRINTFPIALPALRERREDIPLLAEALLRRVAPDRRLGVAPDALDDLLAYDYPGNVRELRNILERASLLCDGDTLERRHLPDDLLPATALSASTASYAVTTGGLPDDATLATLLRSFRGTRRALATHLGVSERTLYRRIREMDVADPPPGGA